MQQHRTFEGDIVLHVSLPYLLYLPAGYDEQPDARWPLLVYLHGAGDRGDDLSLLDQHGVPGLTVAGQELPFIVAAPQCSARTWWRDEIPSLDAFVDGVIDGYRVDRRRVYVTGASMGALACWEVAMRRPERFAALAPLCGAIARPADAVQVLKDVPTWVFHGAKDEAVPIEQSQRLVDALEAVGGNVRFTIYPDAGHDCWTETYANPEFYEWLLAQSR